MTEKANQPLFFQNPVPLQKDVHAKAGLSREISYKFSKNTNSVPVNIQEFGAISKFYPIVFTADSVNSPTAVLGLKDAQNIFVNTAGQWQKDCYIPAYVRRYPFAFMGAEDKLILCVDEASDRFKKKATKTDDAFYEGDEAAPLTQSALQFCVDFQRDQEESLKFSKALNAHDLLVERQINVVGKNKKDPIVLQGFKIVDEEKLRALDDKTVLEWHKNGYLALIYCHIISTSNWQTLSLKV